MLSNDDVTGMLINPIYAVSINPDVAGAHERIVRRQQWIEANLRLMDEIGAEEWLGRLLTALEGDVPTDPDDLTVALGYTRDV